MSRKKSSRKHKQAMLPYQTKHLRFVSPETEEGAGDGEILNNGGFTLAYRVFDLALLDADAQTEWEATTGFLVQYGYSECHLDDNYDKQRGRNTARARLDHMAPEWSHTFKLDIPQPDDADVIKLAPGTAIVDLRGHESLLAQAVVTSFIEEQQDILHNGALLEPFSDYLIVYRGTLALDAAVLLTEAGDYSDGDDDQDSIEEDVENLLVAVNDNVGVLENEGLNVAQQAALAGLLAAVSAMAAIVLGEPGPSDDEDGDEFDPRNEPDDQGHARNPKATEPQSDDEPEEDEDDEDEAHLKGHGHLVATSVEVINTPPVEVAAQKELVAAAEEGGADEPEAPAVDEDEVDGEEEN